MEGNAMKKYFEEPTVEATVIVDVVTDELEPVISGGSDGEL
jgi:hypothetical protein